MKKRKWIILVGIFSILFLIPIWTLKYLPLQDWPIFMGYSYICANISQFPSFHLKPFPPPYATGFFLLAGLMRVIPPLAAGKILLSIYIVAFFAGIGYFLYRLNPEGHFLFFFAPLLAFNYFFAKGNINFILSIPLFLFALPYFVRNHQKRWHVALISFVFSLFIYFTHFFTYLAFLLLVLILMLVRRKGLINFLVSITPIFLFIPYFVVNKAPVELELYRSISLKFIAFRDVFGTWRPYFDVALLVVPFWGLLGFVVIGWRETSKVWKIGLAALLILFLLSPKEIYTLARADQRFLPFIFLILLLFPKEKGEKKLAPIFASLLILLSLVNLAVKQKAFKRMQSEIQRCIVVLNKVPANMAVANIGTRDYYIGVINPFWHILGYQIVLNNSSCIPTYEWNVPIRSEKNLPKAEVEGYEITNIKELVEKYDCFFVMEHGILFEGQIDKFAELVVSDEDIKLFKRK